MLVCVCECRFLIYIGTYGRLLAQELVLGGSGRNPEFFFTMEEETRKVLEC